MTTEVADLLAALRDGTLSLDEVAERFRHRSWPRRATHPAESYLDLAAAAQQDPEPSVSGSFDDVDSAYHRGKITDDQYDVLVKAMAESMRAEDEGRGAV
jgi:hypothetical protein